MPCPSRLRFHPAILPVVLIGALGCGEFAQAAGGRMMAAGPSIAAAESGSQTRTGRAADESKSRKRAVVWSALFLVVGIAVLGVFLIVVVLLWGIRLRRRNRTRKPPPAPFDPLWYLRQRTSEEPRPPPDDADPKPDGTA